MTDKLKTFTYEGNSYDCTEADIIRKLGSHVERLVKCRKGRYGFDIVYKMKPGQYDDRDSGLASTMISYFMLIPRKPKQR